MVTLVGTQSSFTNALQELLELEYDAREAYDTAINKLSNEDYQATLREFRSDHERHIEELTELLENEGEKAPNGPSTGKQWLAKGKVVLGTLIGDKAILMAMRSNEGDTNTAYERMIDRSDKWLESYSILAHALEDERRHKAWLENILKAD